MDYRRIPIFIISKNRLDCLRQLIDWLEMAGHANIHILDNHSTYPPLLQYLDRLSHSVHRYDHDYGHLVLWKSGFFESVINSQPFIVTDPDIVPVKTCPADAVALFGNILNRFPSVAKVGFSLKINDIPDCYPLKKTAVEWEQRFWTKPICYDRLTLYEAPIDTTFALYRKAIRPGTDEFWSGLRTGPPYQARHLSWYLNPKKLNEEERFYRRSITKERTNWSLKKNDVEIRKELCLRVGLLPNILYTLLRIARRLISQAF